VAALIQRVKGAARPNVDEARFVFGGEAYLRIALSDVSAGALEQLRNAGFIIMRQEGGVIIGHAPGGPRGGDLQAGRCHVDRAAVADGGFPELWGRRAHGAAPPANRAQYMRG